MNPQLLSDLHNRASSIPIFTQEVCAFGNLWQREFREEHGSDSVNLFTMNLILRGIREFITQQKLLQLGTKADSKDRDKIISECHLVIDEINKCMQWDDERHPLV